MPKVEGEHPITDHALVRFCERALGIDMDKVRDEILTPELSVAIELGAKKFHQDGLEYRIKHGRVVTIVPSTRS